MTYTTFLLILLQIYLVYYALNIAYDLVMTRKESGEKIDTNELFFEDDGVPELIIDDELEDKAVVQNNLPAEQIQPAISSGILNSTGAVDIKQLFALAKDDLIECTKAIPY